MLYVQHVIVQLDTTAYVNMLIGNDCLVELVRRIAVSMYLECSGHVVMHVNLRQQLATQRLECRLRISLVPSSARPLET